MSVNLFFELHGKCCLVTSNGVLFRVGSIHQGADSFGDVSRGIK